MRGLQIQFLHYIHILAQPARALLQSSTYRILILSQKPQFSIYHPRHKLQCINKFYLLLSIRLDQTAVHPFPAHQDVHHFYHGHILKIHIFQPAYRKRLLKRLKLYPVHNTDSIDHPVLLLHPVHTSTFSHPDLTDHLFFDK